MTECERWCQESEHWRDIRRLRPLGRVHGRTQRVVLPPALACALLIYRGCGGKEGWCSTGVGIERALVLVLVASPKTLSMALPVLAALGAPEAAALPCVLVHLAQTAVDALLVSRWAQGDAAALLA